MFELAGTRCPEGQKTTVSLKAGTREDGSPIEIHAVVLSGVKRGPTLLLTALLHGTELAGAETIRQVLDHVDPSALAGRVVGIPVANPLAFLEHAQSTLRDGLNMNRVFPGQPSGSITQRMAHIIYTHCVKAADAVIDFHTNSYPAVHWVIAKTAGDELGTKTEGMARAFGLTLGTQVQPRFAGLLFAVVLGPMMLFGCAYYPWAQLKAIGAFQYLFLLNPLTFVSEAMRLAVTPEAPQMPLALLALGLVGWLAAFAAIGTRAFEKLAIL